MNQDSNAENIGTLIETARYYHRLALQDDEAALDKATDSIEAILTQDGGHVEALAIRGSLFTIQAKRCRSFLRGLYYSFRAVRVLDRAVKTDPDNATARTIRGFTSLVLPGFLRRLKVAVEDFEYLVRRQKEDQSVVPEEIMPKIYLNLGIAYAKKGDRPKARRVLSEVMTMFPGTDESRRSESLLSRIRD